MESSTPLLLDHQQEQPFSLLLASLNRFTQKILGSSSTSSIPTDAAKIVFFSSQLCAASRAMEQQLAPEERIFTDPYAELLAGHVAMARQRARISQANRGLELSPRIIIRTRYFDDFAENALSNISGPVQMVLLGAGMDTRPLRLKAISERVRIFEIDQAPVLDEKERLLATLNPPPVSKASVHKRLRANVATEWTGLLIKEGFDASIPTVWIIEGLLYYLQIECVEALLRNVDRLSAPGSSFCFSAVRMLKRSTGLPRLFQSCIPEPEAFIEKMGFRVVSVDRLGGPNANYGRTREEEVDRTYYATGMKD